MPETTLELDEAMTAPAIDPEALYEVIDDQRVETPPMGNYQSLLGFKLAFFLEAHVASQGLGRAMAEVLFDLRPAVNRSRRPDVAFVSYERWPKGQRIPRGNAWGVIPDLAVEVVSPHDLADDLIVKIGDYFRAGVRQAWIVYTSENLAYIYESPTQVRIVSGDESLDGGAVVPGFRLKLADLLEI